MINMFFFKESKPISFMLCAKHSIYTTQIIVDKRVEKERLGKTADVYCNLYIYQLIKQSK